MKRNRLLFFCVIALFVTVLWCGFLGAGSAVEFKVPGSAFDPERVPPAPDYAVMANWAVLPDAGMEKKWMWSFFIPLGRRPFSGFSVQIGREPPHCLPARRGLCRAGLVAQSSPGQYQRRRLPEYRSGHCVGHEKVQTFQLRVYADRIVIVKDGQIVGDHKREFGRDKTVFDHHRCGHARHEWP